MVKGRNSFRPRTDVLYKIELVGNVHCIDILRGIDVYNAETVDSTQIIGDCICQCRRRCLRNRKLFAIFDIRATYSVIKYDFFSLFVVRREVFLKFMASVVDVYNRNGEGQK